MPNRRFVHRISVSEWRVLPANICNHSISPIQILIAKLIMSTHTAFSACTSKL